MRTGYSYLDVHSGDNLGIGFETYKTNDMLFGDQVLGHPCLEELKNELKKQRDLNIDIILFKKLPIETLNEIIELAKEAIDER